MGKIKGWHKDWDNKEKMTFWSGGYGLRRGYVEIKKVPGGWFLNIWKNNGYHEEATEIVGRTFTNKKEALKNAIKHMRENPNG